MKVIFIISISILILSCSADLQYCENYSKHDTRILEDRMSSASSYDDINVVPLNTYEEAIEYQGRGGWGGFVHVIRLLKLNGNCKIQLLDSRDRIGGGCAKTLYKEVLITEAEYENLKEMIIALNCKRYQLESIPASDATRFHLILKYRNQIQAYTWENFTGFRDSEETKVLKAKISLIVHKLIVLSGFKNGRKCVLPQKRTIDPDSIIYELFLAECYTGGSDCTVFYEGKKLPMNYEGKSIITVAKKDTYRIKNRVLIEVKMLDGNILTF